MQIGFDASFAINDSSGVGRYSYNLIKYLLEIDKKNRYLLFFNFFRCRSVKQAMIMKLIGDNQNVEVVINNYFGKLKDFIWHSGLVSPLKLYFGKLDIYHASCFQAFPGNIKIKNSLLTIHDLTYLVDPDFHQSKTKYYKKLTDNAVRQTSLIISDSKSTEQDLRKYYGKKLPPIKVIYPGIEKRFAPQSDDNIRQFKKQHTASSDYILFVGTLEPRKNLVRLIKSYQLLPKSLQAKYKLLIIGKRGWGDNLKKFAQSQQIIFCDFIPDKLLLNAYSGATLFVYPSLYEGFGFPPLEAMACGCPVITSNTSSLPEVVGKAALLIDPYKTEEITNALQVLLTSKDKCQELIKLGFKQAKKFSWTKCAQQVIKIYDDLNG